MCTTADMNKPRARVMQWHGDGSNAACTDVQACVPDDGSQLRDDGGVLRDAEGRYHDADDGRDAGALDESEPVPTATRRVRGSPRRRHTVTSHASQGTAQRAHAPLFETPPQVITATAAGDATK